LLFNRQACFLSFQHVCNGSTSSRAYLRLFTSSSLTSWTKNRHAPQKASSLIHCHRTARLIRCLHVCPAQLPFATALMSTTRLLSLQLFASGRTARLCTFNGHVLPISLMLDSSIPLIPRSCRCASQVYVYQFAHLPY